MKSRKSLKIILIVYTIIVVLVPIVVWRLYHGMDWTSWSSMLLSYFGGAIGGIATLIAITLTLEQNNKTNEELVKFQSELKRVDVIPFIDVRVLDKESKSVDEFDKSYNVVYDNIPSGYYIFKKNENVFFETRLSDEYKKEVTDVFEFKQDENRNTKILQVKNAGEYTIILHNIGVGPAMNTRVVLCNSNNKIQEFTCFNMKAGEEIILRLVFIDYPKGEYYLKFLMTDVYGKNYYKQEFKFKYVGGLTLGSYRPTNIPERIDKY